MAGAIGLFAAHASVAQSEPVVYRCENDGVIEFSDQPCQHPSESATSSAQQIHQSSGSISVISPPDDLEDIREDNRAWLESYRDRQAAQDAARSETRRQWQPQSRTLVRADESQGQTIARLRLWPYRPPNYLYRSRQGSDAPPPSRQQPYSALSGPFPGTRPRRLEGDEP